MAVYAIGDVQGCFDELRRLLDALRFDPAGDTLWFTGDLVNRGPGSLETLRFVRDLGSSAITVLGNHDLHLLAVARGGARLKRKDTLDALLAAADRDALLDWLVARPLLHHDAGLNWTLIHAGLPPQWDLVQARSCANEVETVLRGARCVDFLERMYGDRPDTWDTALDGWDRLRFIVNCLTRMRYCDPAGRLALEAKGPLGTQPEGCLPWFDMPGRASRGARIVCGHWSAFGYVVRDDLLALDTGCLWGGALTAQRLDRVEPPCQIDCTGVLVPKGG